MPATKKRSTAAAKKRATTPAAKARKTATKASMAAKSKRAGAMAVASSPKLEEARKRATAATKERSIARAVDLLTHDEYASTGRAESPRSPPPKHKVSAAEIAKLTEEADKIRKSGVPIVHDVPHRDAPPSTAARFWGYLKDATVALGLGAIGVTLGLFMGGALSDAPSDAQTWTTSNSSSWLPSPFTAPVGGTEAIYKDESNSTAALPPAFYELEGGGRGHHAGAMSRAMRHPAAWESWRGWKH